MFAFSLSQRAPLAVFPRRRNAFHDRTRAVLVRGAACLILFCPTLVSLRAAVTIDAEHSDFFARAMVALSADSQLSGYFTIPTLGMPDGGLPSSHTFSFDFPLGPTPFPTSTGFAATSFVAGLTKSDGSNVSAVTLGAVCRTSFSVGPAATNPGYSTALARVTLRLTCAPGMRLRVSADAEQTGGLCRFEITGTGTEFELLGTDSTQRIFIFNDGVARINWVIPSESNASALAPIDEPRATGRLTLAFEELPPPGAVFSAHPQATTVVAGSPLMLHAAASAPAPIEYLWWCDGQPIPGATAADYILPSAQSHHAGVYAVVATSEGVVVSSQSATVVVTEPAPSSSRLINLSTRGFAHTGDDVLIAGFVLSGTQPRRLLIRAVGPTLGQEPFNLPSVLGDPRLSLLRLVSSQYVTIAANDNWNTNINVPDILTTAAQVQAFPLYDPAEAALLVNLDPGQYTVIADGEAGTTGLAVVELYDAGDSAADSRLVNISTRGRAGVGERVMIPGFVVSAEGPKTVLIRVVGPALAAAPFGIAAAMTDPELTVYHAGAGTGNTPLFASDDWGDFSPADAVAAAATQVGAFALAPGSKDAAVVATLAPGVYTVVGSAADGVSSGVVLVEVYVIR